MHAMRLTHPWHTAQEKGRARRVYYGEHNCIRTRIATEHAIINHPLIMLVIITFQARIRENCEGM